jgi:hypothetical protein
MGTAEVAAALAEELGQQHEASARDAAKVTGAQLSAAA